MNKKIIEWLKTDKSFDGAVKLYHEFGNNESFKHQINMRHDNDTHHDQLMHELQQLSGLDHFDFNYLLKQPLIKAEGYVAPKEPTLMEIPEEILKTIKLRDEFPFLKDPDCLNELKILVADRITAYHNYVDAHKQLFEAASDEELQELAATVVENYIDNKEIWEELNYYKENGVLLAKHEGLEWIAREKEIRLMPIPELVKMRDAHSNNICRTEKQIKEHPEHKSTDKRIESVEQKKKELALVEQLLNITSDKKEKKADNA